MRGKYRKRAALNKKKTILNRFYVKIRLLDA